MKPGTHEWFRWFYSDMDRSEGLDERWTEDVVLHQSADVPGTAQSFEGHEGIRAVGRELSESYRDIWWDPREVLELGEDRYLVLLMVGGRGRGSGIEIEGGEIGHLVTLRGGLVARMDVYLGWDNAREAAGVPG